MADGTNHRIVKCAGGIVEIDLEDARVVKHGQPVLLTRTEWKLTETLAHKAGETVSYTDLLASVGTQFQGDFPYLRIWVSRVREKLEPVPMEPRIVIGTQTGYRLIADSIS
jgi:two-component system, OmpR family, KDP operon response regulator KdpE